MTWLLKALVRLYQIALSPYLGGRCRFYPSCSHYGLEALDQHGALFGSVLIVKRLGRCHPWHPGGVDLVPVRRQKDPDRASVPCPPKAPLRGNLIHE